MSTLNQHHLELTAFLFADSFPEMGPWQKTIEPQNHESLPKFGTEVGIEKESQKSVPGRVISKTGQNKDK